MIHVHVALPTPTMKPEEKRAAEAILNETPVPDKLKVETGTVQDFTAFIKSTGHIMGFTKDHECIYGRKIDTGTHITVDLCPTCSIALVRIVMAIAFVAVIAMVVLPLTGHTIRIPYLTI